MDIIGLIKKHINARFRELETMEVVIVESVDLDTWTCSVRPKAKVSVHGDVVDMPQILEVPVAAQKSGDSIIMLPPKVGDVGLVVFSKQALDNLLIDRATTAITIPRNFDIGDAIYIGGLFTEAENVPSISDGEILIHHHTGAYIRFDTAGNITMRGRTITSSEWYP